MRDGWRQTTIGEIGRVVGGSTPSTRNPDLWGGGIPWITPSEVSGQEGRRIDVTSRTISSAGLDSIGGSLLPAGTVLLTSRATVGAVALAGVPMAVNQGFAAIVAGSDVLPEWLMLWCQLNRQHFVALAGGSTFPEVSKPKVRAVTLELPSLAEQRRIVDLVASLDATIAAALRLANASMESRRIAILDAVTSHASESVPVGDVLALVIGGAWGDAPGTHEADVNALNLLVFNNRMLTVDPRFSTRRSFSQARLDRRSIDVDDIILERSGGTDEQPVGRVVYADRALPDAVPTDFMRLLRVDRTAIEPRFVFWWLWARYQRGDTKAFQSKTTNIRNLRVPDYLDLPISLPSRTHQKLVVALGEAFTEAIEGADSVATRSSMLRASLLHDLLSGSHSIPSSYDLVLDGAA